jgi:hypothetical protein
VAEEKETATLTCAFTSVKYLLAIVCRQQACLNYTDIDVEKIVNLHELNILVQSHRDRQIKFLSTVTTLVGLTCCRIV